MNHISGIIKRNVRKSDAYVRFGGEEFAIILPNTNLDEGQIIAERIREDVKRSDCIYNNERIKLTISAGVSLYSGETVAEFIEKTDKALYMAKENGRNRIAVFELSKWSKPKKLDMNIRRLIRYEFGIAPDLGLLIFFLNLFF